MKIKICGITNKKDAQYCSDLGADALGFIFYKKSKRYVAPEIVGEINKTIPALLGKVGVFVDENFDTIESVIRRSKINIVQLHGDEPQEIIDKINLPVIKSFRVDDNFDYKIFSEYKNCSILLDSFHPEEHGGTGNNFNWDKIPLDIKPKIILAGGISANNLENIVKNVKPYAIDVSSSLEDKPGIKSTTKLNLFFNKYNELRK